MCRCLMCGCKVDPGREIKPNIKICECDWYRNNGVAMGVNQEGYACQKCYIIYGKKQTHLRLVECKSVDFKYSQDTI